MPKPLKNLCNFAFAINNLGLYKYVLFPLLINICRLYCAFNIYGNNLFYIVAQLSHFSVPSLT